MLHGDKLMALHRHALLNPAQNGNGDDAQAKIRRVS